MAIETFKRFEKKYEFDIELWDRLKAEVGKYMELDAYCPNGSMYPIYNIYFDNDTNDVISKSIQKPFYKEKLRIRSYKEVPGENDLIFIELKKKVGGIVTKRRTQLTLRDCREYIENGTHPARAAEGVNEFRMAQVLNEIDYFRETYKVKPMLYVSYDRLAYFSREDKNFRLTFDRNITTRRDDLKFESGSYGNLLLPDDRVLMEIKIRDQMPIWCARILSELGIFSTGFSKYGNEYKRHISNDENNLYNKIAMEVV